MVRARGPFKSGAISSAREAPHHSVSKRLILSERRKVRRRNLEPESAAHAERGNASGGLLHSRRISPAVFGAKAAFQDSTCRSHCSQHHGARNWRRAWRLVDLVTDIGGPGWATALLWLDVACSSGGSRVWRAGECLAIASGRARRRG